METMETTTADMVLLSLPGYRVVALKPDFDEHTIQLQRALQKGVPAYPDSVRADFYNVKLDGGEAYLHVYRGGQTIYLVAHSLSQELLAMAG